MFKKFIIALPLLVVAAPFALATTVSNANAQSTASSPVASQDPYTLMQTVAKDLFTQLDNSKAQIQKDPNYLKTVVRDELLPYIQVKYAGALVLGQYYRQATPQQLTQYFNAFSDYLVQAYAQALTLYNGQKYSIEQPTLGSNSGFQAVRVILTGKNGQAPIPLDFQWRKNTQTGQWQAYDMIANGISMITTKQNEWGDVLQQQGITGLTTLLENAAKQSINLESSK